MAVMKLWKKHPLALFSTAEALLVLLVVDFFVELDAGHVLPLSLGIGALTGLTAMFGLNLWCLPRADLTPGRSLSVSGAYAGQTNQATDACNRCGSQALRHPLGPGGGEIVCPRCGPVGVYAYRRSFVV
jgi:hypothetical protein